MNEATTILGSAWTEVTNGITEIMSNNYAALGITLPLVGVVIGIAKRLFSRGRR